MTGEDKFLESINNTNIRTPKSDKAGSYDFWCLITVIPVKMGLRTFCVLQFIGDIFFGLLNLGIFGLASILLSVILLPPALLPGRLLFSRNNSLVIAHRYCYHRVCVS